MTDTLWIIAALSAVALLVGLLLLCWPRRSAMDLWQHEVDRGLRRLARHNQQVERDLRRRTR